MAADERSRAARRAGLQTKKDEQPANTARSCAAKQREPGAVRSGLRQMAHSTAGPTASSATSQEATGTGRGNGTAVQSRKQLEQEKLEAAALTEAEALEVPLAEAAELLADDCEGYVPPTALAPATTDPAQGSLLTKSTPIETRTRRTPGAPPCGASLSNGAGGGEPPSFFRRRQDWGWIRVLVGRDREQELSYPTQLQETWRIFGAAGLVASKKTHLPRRSVLCQAYLTHLPRHFMRIVAGFSAYRGTTHWAEGRLDDVDLASDGFLKLMRHLRIVLLQDLAVLQPRYPSLPFFAYALLNGPEWDEFAVAVRSDAAGATEPLSLLVQRALPELRGVLESTREALLQNSQRPVIRLDDRLERMHGDLDALLQGKVPIAFTGHFGAGPGVLLAPSPVPSMAPTLNFNTAPAPAPKPPLPGIPAVAALVKVFNPYP
ncbi:hypothetical protein BN1723_002436 [Verticillium longisporum]|uniref:Ndc10 domain-containing protein n=1 Tax=Verticillium longisporum TaxID=100787 RepID=A0A0G4L8L4_VERLO|nr:hypothetical protein BN1723_002436 [Verticillium longisporum]